MIATDLDDDDRCGGLTGGPAGPDMTGCGTIAAIGEACTMASEERRLLSAKRLCAGRGRRREEFPEELFADWPWSMLILTYIAHREGRTETRDELFAAAGVSPPVGERWLAYLVQQDLVVEDGAVRLTPAAVARMDRYLDIVIDIAGGQQPI